MNGTLRIREWVIHAFGPFADYRQALGPGLTIVYGPNEAGKSSLMRFLLWNLFPTSSGGRDSVVVRAGHVASGDVYLMLGDVEHRVTRHDRKAPTLHDENGMSLPYSLIDRLDGLDRGAYENVHAFSASELVGLDELGSVDARERLFAGATAGAGRSAQSAQKQVDSRISALWKPRGDAALKKTVQELAIATDELERAQQSALGIGSLVDELKDLTRQIEAERQRGIDARTEAARWRSYITAAESRRSLLQAQKSLAALPDLADLAELDARSLRALRDEREAFAREAAAAKRRADDLLAKAARRASAPSMIAAANALRAAHAGATTARDAHKAISTLTGQSEQAKDRLNQSRIAASLPGDFRPLDLSATRESELRDAKQRLDVYNARVQAVADAEAATILPAPPGDDSLEADVHTLASEEADALSLQRTALNERALADAASGEADASRRQLPPPWRALPVQPPSSVEAAIAAARDASRHQRTISTSRAFVGSARPIAQIEEEIGKVRVALATAESRDAAAQIPMISALAAFVLALTLVGGGILLVILGIASTEFITGLAGLLMIAGGVLVLLFALWLGSKALGWPDLSSIRDRGYAATVPTATIHDDLRALYDERGRADAESRIAGTEAHAAQANAAAAAAAEAWSTAAAAIGLPQDTPHDGAEEHLRAMVRANQRADDARAHENNAQNADKVRAIWDRKLIVLASRYDALPDLARLKELATTRTTALRRQSEANDALRSAMAKRDALADAPQTWANALAAAGLPVTTSPAVLDTVLTAAQQAQRELHTLASLNAEITRQQPIVSTWRAQAAQLLSALGQQVGPSLEAEISAIERLNQDLTAAEQQAKEADRERSEAAIAAQEADRHAAAFAEAERALSGALLTHGLANLDAVEPALARTAESHRLSQIISHQDELVRSHLGRQADEPKVLAQLDAPDPAVWTARADAADREANAADLSADALRERAGAARQDHERAQGASVIAELALEVERLTAIRDRQLNELAQHLVARHLLDEALASFKARHAPGVFRVAAEHLSRATGGAWTGARLDDKDKDIEVRNANADWIPSSVLSRGTTDLLYLCLRLGLARDQRPGGYLLPLMLDDVLVHLDAERADGLADVLASEAADRQVILFTCHSGTLELLRRKAPDATTVTLRRWAGESVPLRLVDVRAPHIAAPQGNPSARDSSISELVNSHAEGLLAAVRANPQGAGKAALLDASGIPEIVWLSTIKALVDGGHVQQVGEKRGRIYFPAAPSSGSTPD